MTNSSLTNPIANQLSKLVDAAEEHATVLDAMQRLPIEGASSTALANLRVALRDTQKRLTRRLFNTRVMVSKIEAVDPARAAILCGDVDGILSALRAEVLEACDVNSAEDPTLLFPLLGAVWPYWLRQHRCDPATLPKKLADVVTAEALRGFRLRPEWEWCAAPALSEISALLSAQAAKAQALVTLYKARGEDTAVAATAALAAAEAFTRAEARAEAAHKELDLRAGISSTPAPLKVLPRQRRQLPRFMKVSALAARS